MTTTATHREIDAVWRIESARIIAGLARMVRDVGVAEELAQDALLAALEQWLQSGVPDNPGAWLMTAAKHRAIDLFRRRKLLERKHEELGRELDAGQETAMANIHNALDDDIGDDLLRLVFTACHPMLSCEARVALTGLELVDVLTDEPALKNYYLLPSLRGDFLVKLGRHDEARVEFERAAALTRNNRERALLLGRAATCARELSSQ